MKTHATLVGSFLPFVCVGVLAATAPARSSTQDANAASGAKAQESATQGSTTQGSATQGSTTQGGGQQAPGARPAGGAAPSDDAFKYGSPAQLQQGLTEPDMWPAASEEGWKKPVLIQWQRNFEDALRVSKATGKPVMVAVNMDGEIASEHWAGVRYRDPETAKFFESYVCVVASVYRHTPRDHDEAGNRIPCPRLGTVTCGEHIDCERQLYDKYFDGMRVSPRHIALDLEAKPLYDVYFAWDTQTISTALVKGIEHLPKPLPRPPDSTLEERIASPDAVERAALEAQYKTASVEVRRTLIEKVGAQKSVDQTELLRLALFGLDAELARAARRVLATSETEGAVDLIGEVLKQPLADDERAMLVEAAKRLAQRHPRASTLASVQEGLSRGSSLLDARRFAEIEYSSQSRAAGAAPVESTLERRVAAAEGAPSDAARQLALAEAMLERAEGRPEDVRFAQLLVADARRAAEAAARLGASGWRLSAVRAAVCDWNGDVAAARAAAVEAIEGGMLKDASTEATVHERTALRVVSLFAAARESAIREAYRKRERWPSEWLADVNAAGLLVAKNRLASVEQLLAIHDFLRWLGGAPRANAILEELLARHPDSPQAHDRLRARLLFDGGPARLESDYEARLAKPDAHPQLAWFAGYAALVAAEHHRREGRADEALASYARGVARYAAWSAANPEGAAEAAHYEALALAGRARMLLERGDLAGALDALLACLERSPRSAASPDGLNITPADTARQLQARLAVPEQAEAQARLAAALAKLDPALLEKREFEREDPRQGRRRRQ